MEVNHVKQSREKHIPGTHKTYGIGCPQVKNSQDLRKIGGYQDGWRKECI
jgi:hypothetical protein